MGVLSYVFLNLLTGKAKKISPVMYVLAVFVCIEISVDLASERILNVRITLLKGCSDILFSNHIICLMVLADFRYQMLPEHIRQQRI